MRVRLWRLLSVWPCPPSAKPQKIRLRYVTSGWEKDRHSTREYLWDEEALSEGSWYTDIEEVVSRVYLTAVSAFLWRRANVNYPSSWETTETATIWYFSHNTQHAYNQYFTLTKINIILYSQHDPYASHHVLVTIRFGPPTILWRLPKSSLILFPQLWTLQQT